MMNPAVVNRWTSSTMPTAVALRSTISTPSRPNCRDPELLAVLPAHQDVAVGAEQRGQVVAVDVALGCGPEVEPGFVAADVHREPDAGVELESQDLDRVPPPGGGDPAGGETPDQPGDPVDVGVALHPVVGEVVHRGPAVEQGLVLRDDPDVRLDASR